MACVDDVFQVLLDLIGVIRAVVNDEFQRFLGEVLLLLRAARCPNISPTSTTA